MSESSNLAVPERRDPFMRAYRALRRDLAAGGRLPGDQIIVTEVAATLGISPTPVREALARLSGERLVDDRRRHGYFVPLPSWFDLIELYDLCEMHVLAALKDAAEPQLNRPAPVRVRLEPGALATPNDETGEVHRALVSLSSSTRMVMAGHVYVEVLTPARQTELALLGGSDFVQKSLDLLARHAWRELSDVVRADFDRRRSRAEPVAFALAAASRGRNSRHIV